MPVPFHERDLGAKYKTSMGEEFIDELGYMDKWNDG